MELKTYIDFKGSSPIFKRVQLQHRIIVVFRESRSTISENTIPPRSGKVPFSREEATSSTILFAIAIAVAKSERKLPTDYLPCRHR